MVQNRQPGHNNSKYSISSNNNNTRSNSNLLTSNIYNSISKVLRATQAKMLSSWDFMAITIHKAGQAPLQRIPVSLRYRRDHLLPIQTPPSPASLAGLQCTASLLWWVNLRLQPPIFRPL